MTSPSEPLVQIQNNFTELFIMMLSTKITQIVPSIEQMDVRALDKKCLLVSFPTEPLV